VTRDEWQRVWQIYQSACGLPPLQRAAMVESSLTDISLREEVFELLSDLDEPDPPPPPPAPPAAPSEWQLLSQSLGRFQIVSPIGRGGMGEVYSAFDPDLDRNVAIKCIAPGRLGAPAVVAGFIREARSASALNHPGIVTIYEVIRTSDTVAIVMEKVEGDSLRKLAAVAQPLEKVAACGQRIAEALAASHAGGIIHRDIKPENLILRADGYVKILDFGLAMSRAVSAGALPMGTLRYMSPEQGRAAELTPATDIFSLGIVLYELATGLHPFARPAGEDSTVTIVQAVAEQPVRHPSAVVRSLRGSFDRLILEMLAKDPAVRPSAQQVATRLAALRQGSRRSGRYGLAMGAAAVLGVALAAWWIGSRNVSPTQPAHIVPFTTYDGSETQPAFSPDGSRIVFAWTGPDGSNKDIYVKGLGEDQPQRLTTNPEEDFSPRFSPDGRSMVFQRRTSRSSESQVLIMAAAGGPERLAGRVAPDDGYRGLVWWPDGESLLLRDIVDHRGCLLRLFLDDGHKQPFTVPREAAGDATPEFSPDGKTVAFLRRQAANVSLCLAAAGGGPVRSLLQTSNIRGLAWEPGGKSLLYSDDRGLWRVSVDSRWRTTPQEIAEGVFAEINADRGGDRLAFSRVLSDANIWRVGRNGKGVSRLIASSGEDSEPEWSPDGAHIVVRSNRTGAFELYTYNADGTGPRQITKFGSHLGSARWSPDGQWIVFDGAPFDSSLTRHNIFLVSAAGGPVRRLTDDRNDYEVPSWSRDGQWIYFQMKSETWKLPVAGGSPVQVDTSPLFDVTESDDGQYLYYAAEAASGVWRRPLTGGTGTRVPGTEGMHFFRYWRLLGDELFFVDGPPGFILRSLNVKTGRSVRIAELPAKLMSGPRGMAVSPDGSTILYSQEDLTLSDIMLIDNLKQLIGLPGSSH
jgi:serine/threonine protein kinase